MAWCRHASPAPRHAALPYVHPWLCRLATLCISHQRLSRHSAQTHKRVRYETALCAYHRDNALCLWNLGRGRAGGRTVFLREYVEERNISANGIAPVCAATSGDHQRVATGAIIEDGETHRAKHAQHQNNGLMKAQPSGDNITKAKGDRQLNNKQREDGGARS